MKVLKLTKNKYSLIDDEDYDRISFRKWSYHRTGYAVGGNPQVRLHRFIMNAPKNKEVDHKNGDKLDNRKSNLRICDRSENSRNYVSLSTKKRNLPRGIEYRPTRKAYAARIKVRGKSIYLGYYKNLEEAQAAYKEGSLMYHGEFSIYA